MTKIIILTIGVLIIFSLNRITVLLNNRNPKLVNQMIGASIMILFFSFILSKNAHSKWLTLTKAYALILFLFGIYFKLKITQTM